MFCFFKNDVFENFWGNKIGDIFCDLTCNALSWEKSLVDLNYYFISEVPKFYEFDQNKNLIIKKEAISYVDEVFTDAEGNEVVTQVEVKNYEVDKIVEPIVYLAKGIMVRPC